MRITSPAAAKSKPQLRGGFCRWTDEYRRRPVDGAVQRVSNLEEQQCKWGKLSGSLIKIHLINKVLKACCVSMHINIRSKYCWILSTGMWNVYKVCMFLQALMSCLRLPSTGVAVFAEVSARLTGGQLEQLTPLSLPLLLGVYQPRLQEDTWQWKLWWACPHPHNPYYYFLFPSVSTSLQLRACACLL